MKKKLTTALTAVLACALALGVTVGLAACGGESDADKAKAAVTTELDALIGADEDAIRDAVDDDTLSQYEDAGIDVIALYQAMFGGCTYEVTDVTIDEDGETGVVTVDAENVDLEVAMEDFQNAAAEYAQSDEYADADQTEVMEKLMSLLVDAINDCDETSTGTTEIDVEKDDDGEWEVSDENQVVVAALAGVDTDAIGM